MTLVLSGTLVVSGTGTGVGKTIVTAALAALSPGCAVVKPAQTGLMPGEEPDLDVVRRLSGVTDTHELARFPDPLSPEAAARVSGRKPLDLSAVAGYIRELGDRLVLVEGAGGLLVRYDPSGTTIADLAAMLDAPVLVVTEAGLGTLNHTTLTLEALRARGLSCAGVVIGSWPREPGLAERENLTDLRAAAGSPLAGILPAGAGLLPSDQFHETARLGLAPSLGGIFTSDSPRIDQVRYDHPDAALLIEEVQQEYVVRYGGPDGTPVDPDEFAPPRGTFLVCYAEDPVACGGWRSHGTEAEIKRMYVTKHARRAGYARLVLAELERTAREAGHHRIVLETGSKQPEAVALYRSAGYTDIRPFGHYADSPHAIHLGKVLI